MVITTPTPAEVLTRLAEQELDGLLCHHDDSCLARVVREAAPALASELDDAVVLERFADLCEDVGVLKAYENGGVAHFEVLGDDATGSDLDGQALDACRARVDDTLAKLITPPTPET